jgi:serine/threonine protein kinase
LYDTVTLHYDEFKTANTTIGRKITAICEDIMQTLVRDDVVYKYFKEGLLDYDDHIHNGVFYDIVRRDDFRPLEQLRDEKHDPEELETIVVDIQQDQNLAIIVAQVQQLMEKAKSLKKAYQLIAKVVDEYVRNINAGDIVEQRTKEGHVLNIGRIRGGVGRHRAILFKFLCDKCCTHEYPLRSRLVRSIADPQHAWNVIKSPTSNSTFIVDIMNSPGKLLTEDELEGQRYRRGDFQSYGGNSVRGLLSQFQLQTKNTSKMRELGVGASGIVYAANVVTADSKVIPVAVKAVDTSVFDREVFLHELDLLQYVTHPHVIKYYMNQNEMLVINGVQQKRLCMYMELMDMSADSFMKNAMTNYSTFRYIREVMYILLGTARGLRYLHSRKITHRDIKPMNILLRVHSVFDTVTDVKIADFGLSKVLPETLQTHTIVGTPGYLAPEVEENDLLNKSYNAMTADIYSFGITIGELLCMQRPRKGGYTQEELSKVVGNDPMLVALVEIYQKCVERDPEKRQQIDFDTEVCDKLMELIYLYL